MLNPGTPVFGSAIMPKTGALRLMQRGAIINNPRFHTLWAVNAPLDQARLRGQLDQIRRDGFDGVVFHPRFYPGQPPYLSDEYLRIVSGVILHAQAIGLSLWIYDENGWPSGIAGGELLRRYPDDAGGVLTLHRGGDADAWHTFEARGCHWHLALHRTREIDYLNPAACAHFLSLTHDRYRDGLDPAAWAHVEAFFTDEPEFGLGANIDRVPPDGAVPWSPGIEALYLDRTGRDFRADLPLVFFNDPEGAHEEARIQFWEFMTDRLCKGFFEPNHAWCRREGKLFTGHLKGDEHPLFQVMMNGSAHQVFRHFDLPGIDPLERFPACDYYARDVASAARQYGTGRAMAEVMGGGGWGSTPADLERFLLWLANHGVSDLVIHLYQYRLDSHAIRDWPPANPNGLNWREAYADVLRRIRFKTDASAVARADTLVVAPYRGMMAAYEPWSLPQSNIHNCVTYPETPAGCLNREFLYHSDQMMAAVPGHHYADARSLEEHGRVEGGRLFIGRHGYTKVILAEGCRLTPIGQRLLQAVEAAGGRVLSDIEAISGAKPVSSPLPGDGVETSCAILWDGATTPVNDFLLEPTRDAETGWWRAEFVVESALAALAVEFADDIVRAELDGAPLQLEPTTEGPVARLPLAAATPGRHALRFMFPGQDAGPLFAWIRGEFRVLSQTSWTAGPNGTRCTAGPWVLAPMTPVAAGAERVEAGWPFAREPVTVRGKMVTEKPLPEGTRLTCVGIMADVARLTVDGADCGWVWGPDWSVVLPFSLGAGAHRVELDLVPSTFNRFGPHHHIDGDRHVVSPGQFSGVKNFADHAAAPERTHDSRWRVKPLVPPSTALCLLRKKASP
jgi:hypothetical protein